MTLSKSAIHSADYSADYSADHNGQLSLLDHGLNVASADSADDAAILHTRAHAQNKLENGRHGLALPALTAPDDPAAAYPNRAARRAAWAAWEADGEPWPPPAGLTSAGLDACRPDAWRRERWQR